MPQTLVELERSGKLTSVQLRAAKQLLADYVERSRSERYDLAMGRVVERHKKPLQVILFGNVSPAQYAYSITGIKNTKECERLGLRAIRAALTDLDKVYCGERRQFGGNKSLEGYIG